MRVSTISKFLNLSGLSHFLSKFAPINSPAFTGNPTCTTPAAGTSDTQVINTSFVQSEYADKIKKSDLIVDIVMLTNVNINDFLSSSVSVAKSGYTTLGVVGWNIDGNWSTYCLVSYLYTSGNTCYYQIRPRNGTATNLTIKFYILYRKS